MPNGERLVINRLLRALDPAAYLQIAPCLRRRTLQPRQVVYKADERMTHVYFPETSVISLLTVMRNGATIQTAAIGREGGWGLSATAAVASMPCEAIAAIGGEALIVTVHDLDRIVAAHPHAGLLLSRYAYALLAQSLRTTGCTGLHSLEQRSAAWILTALDRVNGDGFSMTHELLATLLGANRPSVSRVLTRLQARGVLQRARGRVVVADRDKLLRATCDCYTVLKCAYERLEMAG
jgi:CRP-like cAMP-binding protein